MEYKKEYNKEYKRKNRDKILKEHKEYYIKNKTKINYKNKIYYKDNKDKYENLRKNNKEKMNLYNRLYYIKNSNKIKKQTKEYQRNNKEKINLNIKNKRKEDINFKIKGNLCHRIIKVLKGKSKSARTLKLLGIPNIEFLWQYLEKQFDSNMTRKNYGTYWEIDHKIACALYDFTCPAQQFMCFNYINLRPYEKSLNRSKGKKTVKEFEAYKNSA